MTGKEHAEKYRRIARRIARQKDRRDDGTVIVCVDAETYQDDRGAWVQAWVRVSDKLQKPKEVAP